MGEGAITMAKYAGTLVVVGTLVFFFLPAVKRDPESAESAA